jgi:predicted nucleic acid-binding protein
MIVVDTNVIAYLFLKGEHFNKSKALLGYDPEWIAPQLWRSEFCNVLAFYIRHENLRIEDAQALMHEAELFMQDNEYTVNSNEILELVKKSSCSAYDCEFIALAQRLNLWLYTSDKKIIKEFPHITKSLLDVM